MVLPCWWARRRIPWQALGLKKNLAGTCACKICDKQDSLASLGQAEELRVEYSPRNAESSTHNGPSPAPAACRRRHTGGARLADADERGQDGREIMALVGVGGSGDVLPDRQRG